MTRSRTLGVIAGIAALTLAATPVALLLPFCLTPLSNRRRLEAPPRVPPGFSRWQSPYRIPSFPDLDTGS